jgi:hypothetical protein
VIEISSTVFAEDTALVSLESEARSINSDRYGLNGDSLHHGLHVVGRGGTLGDNHSVGGLVLVVDAGSLSALVRVVGLGHGLSSFVVVIGPGGETSIATLVLSLAVVAIDELLLREGGKRVSLNLPDTFEASSGGERPARTALSLILSGGDGTCSNPIDRGSSLDSLERVVLYVVSDLGGLGSTEELLVFGLSPGGHLVVSESVGRLGGVVLVDESIHLFPVGHSEVVLFNSTVGETELGNVTEEFRVGRGGSNREGSDE